MDDNDSSFKRRVWEAIGAIAALIKLRLNAMAVIPALCSYAVSGGNIRVDVLMLFTVGALLAGFAASVLNQWSERTWDARMQRTAHRMLASGTMQANVGLALGLGLAAGSSLLMYNQFGWLTGSLTLLTVFVYWLIYTPLKRRTGWCTEAGAVSGAMPALIGGAAAGGVGIEAWSIFGIVLLWQMPHFHPIAWRYREDYARAGFRMLSVIDPTGRRAGNSAVIYASILIPISLSPLFWSAGRFYGFSAVLLGIVYWAYAVRFRFSRNRDAAAVTLFRVSLIYLLLLLGVLIWSIDA